MKNLANCKPSEFLKQTNRIRKSVSKWLTDTDILNIRKRIPNIDENASEEEKALAKVKQAKQNISDMFDAILDEHPDETLEVIALLCFVEPNNVDDYSITEYMDAVSELLNNESVIGFFTSLIQSVNRLT